MGDLKHLLKHFAKYKWAVIGGVVCLLFVDGMQLIIPRIIKRAVDDLTYSVSAHSNLLSVRTPHRRTRRGDSGAQVLLALLHHRDVAAHRRGHPERPLQPPAAAVRQVLLARTRPAT